MKIQNITMLGTAVAPLATAIAAQNDQQPTKPNIVIIMTDQQRADLCRREGFKLDVTPFVDRMASEGVWLDKAYTTAPASVPARVSMLTGRFPKATRVNSNHNAQDVFYNEDLYGLARKSGYRTALVGKNHSHMKRDAVDYESPYGHGGSKNAKKDKSVEEFNRFLGSTILYSSLEPTPFAAEMQQPYRMVDDALVWINSGTDNNQPFLMWLSFAEPHNPYQASEPYFSMFPPEELPKLTADINTLDTKGERYALLSEMMELGHVGYSENLQRLRSIYMGMVRQIDDQIGRFVTSLRNSGVYDNTIFVVTADHGDYVGEYGLMKKGVGLSDVLSRVPMVWFGKGIKKQGLSDAHVSLADIFPTLCEMSGCEIPMGVQGRSLAELLAGRAYPKEEFRSVMIEDGYGGQYYTKADGDDFRAEGAVHAKPGFFDELNTWSQSGSRRALRMGDWKLEYDMMGNGELYNLRKDPSEIKNLFNNRKFAAKQSELMAELLKWEIATEDPLPIPRNRYRFKRNPHNYLFINN